MGVVREKRYKRQILLFFLSKFLSGLKSRGIYLLRNSKRKFPSAEIGDTVQIHVPEVDRGRADARNVLKVVIGVEEK